MPEGFTDITPPISSILTYTPAMKIGSSIIVGGIGGNFIPGGGGGSSSSMNFYKCASIDTTNHTWTGYLASVDSVTGIWSFAETATSGLTYDRITPVVGHVYDSACTFEVRNYKTGLPTDDLVFYLPLDSDPDTTDETGKTLNYYGKQYFTFGTTYQGIRCTLLGGSNASLIGGPDFTSIIPNDATSAFTLSAWISSPDQNPVLVFGFNPAIATGVNYMTGLWCPWDHWDVKTGGGTPYATADYRGAGFCHVLLTFSSNTVTLYINGTLISQNSFSTTDKPFGSQTAWLPIIGGIGGGGSTDKYIAAFRIYKRVLDRTEIAALAAEFSPISA